MRSDIDAIAFDIDGTLYPNGALYRRVFPFIAKNLGLMRAFGAVRRRIRSIQEENPGRASEDFFAWQRELLCEEAGVSSARADRFFNDIYEGWRPVFQRIRPFPGVREAFLAFKESGLKIGILSDFLPSQKGSIWDLAPLADVILGSEETGALKPSPIPFLALAERLGTSPGRVLYVGNSVPSDIIGGRAAGMKTALIAPLFLRDARADISFGSYRKLTALVLK
jgi:putative hydrolase of the HAD superfamily